jgi:hypothetical protein
MVSGKEFGPGDRGPHVIEARSILRREMHRRMLANGYYTRPVETDCHLQSICEPCTSFITTIQLRPAGPTRRRGNKGQVTRQRIFDRSLTRLDDQAPRRARCG